MAPGWVAPLLLAGLAVAGNALAIELYYGVHFIFGSIFVLVAVRTLGAWPAILVAVCAALYTRVLWGHYYASIVFIAECLFVLAFCRRTSRSLFLADSVFWCLLGIPATVVLYHFAMEVSLQTALVIAIKQMLNGVFNAAMAGLLLCSYYLLQNRIATGYLVSSQIRSIIFHTILMTALVSGSVPILEYASFRQQTQVRDLERELSDNFQKVAGFIREQPDHTSADWQRLTDSLGNETRVVIFPADSDAFTSGQFTVDHVRSDAEPSVIKSWQEGTYQLSGVVEVQPPIGVVISRSARSVATEMDAASLDFLGNRHHRAAKNRSP